MKRAQKKSLVFSFVRIDFPAKPRESSISLLTFEGEFPQPLKSNISSFSLSKTFKINTSWFGFHWTGRDYNIAT